MAYLSDFLLFDNTDDPLYLPVLDAAGTQEGAIAPEIAHDLHEALSRLRETAFQAVACRASSEEIFDLARQSAKPRRELPWFSFSTGARPILSAHACNRFSKPAFAPKACPW